MTRLAIPLATGVDLAIFAGKLRAEPALIAHSKGTDEVQACCAEHLLHTRRVRLNHARCSGPRALCQNGDGQVPHVP
eukprot:1635264-Alexandrium_andersonii.AAC.1